MDEKPMETDLEGRKRQALQAYFGYTSFLGGQEELIDAQMAGRDALGVMPTGGGKSLCYQLPALLLEGLTLVISPLISLMKDQIMALKNAGIPAACINSAQTAEEARQVYRELWAGRYKLLYVAPERLMMEGFLAAIEDLNIPLVAVDEAHCISQWGQDFRPSYLRIPDFLSQLPRRPVVSAFTATATPQVREDIVRLLGLREPLRVITGFDRPNLRFEVLRPKDKSAALAKLLAGQRGRSGIVYCATRKGVEEVAEKLEGKGFSVTRYHAGLSPEERRANQEDFVYDRKDVMVATNAFGMGIDKSNVGFVIHYNMPKSLEAYYQEAGRAGRDGSPARCILLFSPGDIHTARYLIQNSEGNEALSEEERDQIYHQDLARLERMAGYCKTTGCLRGYILDYFGQEHSERCENCGNCLADFTERDVTREAQMILSCVRRIRDKLGYAVGADLTIQVLRGKSRERLLNLGLDELSTYGLMKNVSQEELQALMEFLLDEGYLYKDPAYGGLTVTRKAGGVLFHGETVTIRRRAPTALERRVKGERRKKTAKAPAPATPLAPPAPPETTGEEALFEALRALRYRLAQEEGVPAYMIFSNATLIEMARRSPADLEAFLAIPGVGAVKARRYGEDFLVEIQRFREQTGEA